MKTKRMLFEKLFFVVTMILLLFNLVEAEDNEVQKLIKCRENERLALLEFKAGVVDRYGMLSSWVNNNKEEECCDWRGIRCSNLTGHVTLLNLPGQPIITEYYYLTGKISPCISELKHLKYLNLSYNLFDGTIPPQLGNLTNLLSLDLRLNGDLIVNLEWVSHLHLLTHLDLRSVNLSSCNNWLNQINKLSSLTHLLLSFSGLPDPLLPLNTTSLSAFNSLAVADLSGNNFISPKSYNWLFNFTTTLVSLDLSYNFLKRGGIPEAFGRFTSLESLFLSYNNLEGMLPDSFTNLSRLATLDLNNNFFNVSLSKFLSPLATKEKNSLQVLRLDMNQLHGSLPDYFTIFPSLREILIRNNKLSGSFPDNFGQLSSSLVKLDLSGNQLIGPLPNLTLFSSLETLTLRNNNLEDTIPETYLSNLTKLRFVDLSYNSLSLNVSVNWVPSFQLEDILLANCSTLGPQFPNWLRSQRNFSRLDISFAGISDTIPLWFWDLSTSVWYLNTSHNNIRGTLPDLSLMSFSSSVTMSSFMITDMSFNNLTGPIPRLPLDILSSLDLSQNMFTGSLSFLCTAPSFDVRSIRLSDNQLSGELPDCSINFYNLQELNLANNTFSGKLPASIGSLDRLEILQLRGNSFSGELPSSVMNCSNLVLLDLSDNNLSGEVPAWIGTHLKYLIIFSLGKNNFFGRVPPQICLLSYVQVVDLSRNNLSRSIPNCVNNFTALLQREDSDVALSSSYASDGYIEFATVPDAYLQWKGKESLYKSTIRLLKLIDLSGNRLVGEIPEELASLKGLMSLNLSSNRLSGKIIPSIGQMNNLEVLDLSENNLSGEIPASLSDLTFLDVLDLSRNHLTGKIPSSTQLQSFKRSSYAFNDNLCGQPLPDECPDDEANGNAEHDEESEDRFITLWFYISLVLGFVTGFWGFLGPVMLRGTWRHAYSRLLEKITDWIYVTTSRNIAKLQRKIYG